MFFSHVLFLVLGIGIVYYCLLLIGLSIVRSCLLFVLVLAWGNPGWWVRGGDSILEANLTPRVHSVAANVVSHGIQRSQETELFPIFPLPDCFEVTLDPAKQF